MNSERKQEAARLLQFLYGKNYHQGDEDELEAIAGQHAVRVRKPLTEKDNFLIIYPDAIRNDGEASLAVLDRFLKRRADFISNVHLLPFFPFSSDDGYAVMDYDCVRTECGSWEDVERLSETRGLIFDFAVNHVSSESLWLKRYLDGDPEFRDFFIEYDETFDTSKTVRPRPTPLYHEYTGKAGTKRLWTTFSADQVDLNYRNFRVLLKMCRVLAEYLEHGARCIRLDAVCYLWKESGTSCCSLEQTHAVIRLLRLLMDEIAPGSVLLTQTNVPHEENLSYFGDGTNEAGMVYQFALPPLVLHAILSGQADLLVRWAGGVENPPGHAAFFNFLGGHDGVGLRPVRNLLDHKGRELLVENTLAEGGKTSSASLPGGGEEVYELNTNYLSALTCPGDSEEIREGKTLAAHSILCSLMGVPAIYYHALFGSGNDCRGMEESGMPRRINRQKFSEAQLETLLKTEGLRREILEGLKDMLTARGKNPAFGPYNPQKIHQPAPGVMAVERYQKDGNGERILTLTNVGREPEKIYLKENIKRVLLSRGSRQEEEKRTITLMPYGYLWAELERTEK